MRNYQLAWKLAIFRAAIPVFCVLLLVGCASEAKTKENLKAGYASLESKQFDDAISRADAHLQKHPTGAGSAEALYLRGRALEQKPAASQTEARANLLAARDAYQQALKQNPPAKLKNYIETSMGNCSYFLDDYQSAANEWTAVYDRLADPAIKGWVLYRVGICRQRTGQFDVADQIFAKVQKDFPGTVPSQRAREHEGARAFTVQLATFANSGAADSALSTLRREGVLPVKTIDPAGRSVLRVGPINNYQQALALKQRYADRFPDARILP
jgi:TolA-binding protein